MQTPRPFLVKICYCNWKLWIIFTNSFIRSFDDAWLADSPVFFTIIFWCGELEENKSNSGSLTPCNANRRTFTNLIHNILADFAAQVLIYSLKKSGIFISNCRKNLKWNCSRHPDNVLSSGKRRNLRWRKGGQTAPEVWGTSKDQDNPSGLFSFNLFVVLRGWSSVTMVGSSTLLFTPQVVRGQRAGVARWPTHGDRGVEQGCWEVETKSGRPPPGMLICCFPKKGAETAPGCRFSPEGFFSCSQIDLDYMLL